jgi:hypothetical protein
MTNRKQCIVLGCTQEAQPQSLAVPVCAECRRIIATGEVPVCGNTFIHTIKRAREAALIDAARWRAARTSPF